MSALDTHKFVRFLTAALGSFATSAFTGYTMVAHFGVAINYAYTGSVALFVFLLGAYLSTQRSGQGK